MHHPIPRSRLAWCIPPPKLIAHPCSIARPAACGTKASTITRQRPQSPETAGKELLQRRKRKENSRKRVAGCL